MITARAFAGKHYAVYGLARSGLATVEALLASGARVTAWDGSEKTRENFRSSRAKSRGAGITEVRPSTAPGTNEVELVDLDTADLTEFDSLVVTPGLPLNRHPIAARAREARLEIIGDIELFARARSELPPHKVVGITGTNGKSTTTALVHHLLKTAGVPTTMGGNIGLPILSQDPLPAGGVYVLELSSYQIDLTQSLDCDVAVLLNITPDHLDRYESFEAYAASKARLFAMQSAASSAVVVGDDVSSGDLAATLGARRVPTALGTWGGPDAVSLCPDTTIRLLGANRTVESSLLIGDDRHGDQSQWPTLQGPHNAQNVLAAVAAVHTLAVGHGVPMPEAAIAEGLRAFPGLPHRMERAATHDGVLFVNDSKATNPTATAPALAAFKPVRWILGGQAKSDDLDECAPHFGNVASAYTIGEAAELFERLLNPHMPVKNCGKLADAVRQAARDSQPGDTVLLSPACASFDQFRDFEDRGDQFKALVGAL
ncbi:UDP-N-acetylmuramoyl-L-alanine--D-glutamate ligase [Sphingomonas sabuli]|uniref:UDP-N-acetylmuramoylalanine--D-glutamate ligase n=1 Tax=Sphingomonas sabuli TaxID=2764186 RepID=A0A7G9L1M7_9SPHN|nr:UDP-N-acetylmuramoyl-L-alanine--D-glutamate ligase [Sphingomonas sabuli]QNM82526.1 UDP-N-acetylmuramoyl-L-alanine--D-glutamate ligase [Sphingomonas sabuli]